MLSQSCCQAIAQFKNTLEQLDTTVQSTPLDQGNLKIGFQQVQQVFKTQIMGITETDFDPPAESKVQSFLTETHKQMRLLELDLKFLQASRQSTTTTTRLNQVSDRLTTLLSYADAMLV